MKFIDKGDFAKKKKISVMQAILYVIIVVYVMVLFFQYREHYTYFEIDSYVLPTISLEYRGSLLMEESDLKQAQIDYPNLYQNINTYEDLRSSKLMVTETGKWEAWYFPTYSILCLPIKIVLQLFSLNQELTFGIFNVICIATFLLAIIRAKDLSILQKYIIVLLTMAAPSFLYVRLISAEIMMFSFIGIGLLRFYQRKYKRGAIAITLAGMVNSTIMIIGIIFIIDYFVYMINNNKGRNWKEILSREMLPTICYGLCYVPSLFPFILKKMTNVGQFTSVATTHDYFGRYLEYVFDPNLGIMSFAPVMLILFIYTLYRVLREKKIRAICFAIPFFGVIAAYSLMYHINCGMLYCSRYVYWTYPIMIIFIGIAGYENIKNKKIVMAMIPISVICSICLLNVNKRTYYNWERFNEITETILNYIPGIYNPIPSTFNSRTNRVDGGYDLPEFIIYEDSEFSQIRKILVCGTQTAKENLSEAISVVIGENSLLENELEKIPNNGKFFYINISRNENTQYYYADIYGAYDKGEFIGQFSDVQLNANQKSVVLPIGLKENTLYEVQIDVNEASNLKRVRNSMFDFYGVNYDNPEQERYSFIKAKEYSYSFIINSGNMEEVDQNEFYLRLFVNSEQNVIFDNITIREIRQR